jgi:hypothetical protein
MKPPAVGVWTPRLRAASDRISDRVRAGSSRVAVWTRDVSMRKAHRSHTFEPINPVYIIAAITLGIPALLMIPLIGMNPGIQEGAFSNVVTFVVVTAFVIAAAFEIKKLADQPSEHDHH